MNDLPHVLNGCDSICVFPLPECILHKTVSVNCKLYHSVITKFRVILLTLKGPQQHTSIISLSKKVIPNTCIPRPRQIDSYRLRNKSETRAQKDHVANTVPAILFPSLIKLLVLVVVLSLVPCLNTDLLLAFKFSFQVVVKSVF